MPIAQHHAEWLSLLEISGPFLSLPVLGDEFPQGIESRDPDLAARLRAAYEEWQNNQQGLRPDAAIHSAWIDFVLEEVLELTGTMLARDPAQMDRWTLTVAEYGETLRADVALVDPRRGQAGEGARLLVMRLPADQPLDRPLHGRHWKALPGTRMMELLHAAGVRLGLLTNGEQWMLVNAPRGETTGFISWYASLWLDEPLTLRAFATLLRAGRFFAPDDSTLEALLAASAADQQDVTDRLGGQVRHAVELLVQALDGADQESGRALLAEVSLPELYRSAVTVMMRLVFLLGAEERGLLPLDDDLYSQHYAVSTLQGQLRAVADQTGEEVLEYRHDAWQRLLATFRVVHAGIYHDRLHLPAYGGSLFDPNEFPFLEGRGARSIGAKLRTRESAGDFTCGEESPALARLTRESAGDFTRGEESPALARLGDDSPTSPLASRPSPLRINNRTVLHLLEALQFLQMDAPGGGRQAQRLSFRALDIEQIGHVYEGLLDHTAVRAADTVLGLQGTRNQEPEIALAALEAFLTQRRDPSALIDFLRQQTGRSANALRNALTAPPPDLLADARLRTACNNDERIYRRVLPFHALLREDDYGRPLIIPAGSVYVTAGTERRATGAHYTPRTLTEPIVQHTLEPLVYVGPAEGKPRGEWQLRRPDEILALKVCDMAMGSGAFLVQCCRYLSERLVEALEEGKRQSDRSGRRAKGKSGRSDPSGSVQSVSNALSLLQQAESDEERLTLGRRLVADRCLYGVDKNPLAVEMAKLSLWLITMDRGKPFTFLDHALKCGDSLVGVDLAQLSHWHLHPDQSAELFTIGLQLDIERLVALRQGIEEMPVIDVRDQEAKAYKLAQADALAHTIKGNADLLVASYLNDLGRREGETLRAALLLTARDGASVEEKWRQHVDLGGLQPFHWPLEFPEVFLGEGRNGFDAFVGNPPFIGGKRIRDTLGGKYRVYLDTAFPQANGNTDLSAFFFLRSFFKLQSKGTLGLIATNTIAQGDTRLGGLEPIVKDGGTIFRAINNLPWPGYAAVVVSVVHIARYALPGPYYLDENPVSFISSQLDQQQTPGNPFTLINNKDRSFIGSFVNGMGFVLEPDEAHRLIDKDPRNLEVVFPYLNGQDLNSHPEQQPSRWVINFFDWPRERTAKGHWSALDAKQQQKAARDGVVPFDYPGPVAADYADCYEILKERVYPVRIQVNREAHRKYWWHYGDKRPALYATIAPLQRVLVKSRVADKYAWAFVPQGWVYNERLVILAFDDFISYCIIQSSINESWSRQYASSLKMDMLYNPSDCFENFPFPQSPVPSPQSPIPNLQSLGEAYHAHRAAIMRARQEGLTATYNRFHDTGESAADIVRLRGLHVEMDNAVAASYGWGDLALGHGFHETAQGMRYTIHESARRQVLARLLALNHARYEEEVRAGRHEKKGKGKAKGSPTATVGGQKAKGEGVDEAQLGLF
ncbi:MAG: hypothetical protein KF893_20570 [Caldilineaceae bacterium]|nr:hypothetical protein [Caldilineaceae bacterium]